MTSIVVLHYGRHELTDACLAAIEDGPEVVLVDNDPGYLHERVDVLVRPRKNVGYARGCNLGAAVASNAVTVFLNNDTEVQPGWLDAMLSNFVEPTVGVVGAQLRYPNGQVQHAGVDVFRDDHGTLTGAHASPALAEIGRPVQAVTGACMAIRSDLFSSLGGFCEQFWNGYEDVDLCLAAAAEGWTIRYEPRAVVVHHESASGAERWRRVRENVALLQERWPNECRGEA